MRPLMKTDIMEMHDVKIQGMRALRGPNLYAYMPVLHIVMDIGPYEEKPSNSFPGFVERLTTWLPGLQKHECGLGRPGGFIERLQRGTYFAHIAEHICLELQGLMGFNVTFGRARSTDKRGVYTVVVAYEEEVPARTAFEIAARLTLAAMHDESFDLTGELERLLTLADEYRLGPSTGAIVKAARKRNIPVLRLTPTGSLVQLGYGVHQKRILASETSNTSAIAVELCQEKPLTNRMLRAVGVPVSEGRSATSADDAWTIAQEIGVPVVVKPESGNQGKGVSVNLRTEAEIRAAFTIAQKIASEVLVERHIEGADYRLLVVNGKMVAAALRRPPEVMGDGQRTIRELVEDLNTDPRRRPGHSSVLTQIILDEVARLVLAQQNRTFETVLDIGQRTQLRTNCNLSTGGIATDVTEGVHPANARLAELAAQILCLDVAGIDIVCRDIARPLAEQGGAIVEVNAAPGLRMHMSPTQGHPRDVATPIVEMLYPNQTSSRIPIVAITGTNGKTTVTRLVGHMFDTAHWVVGMTCTDGTFIDGEPILSGDCSGPRSAQAVLLHPRVEVAVLETARGGILHEGLAFDACSVGLVTNVTADHLGIGGVETLEDLAKVKQVVIEAVDRDGVAVLNADDSLVAEMAAATDAPVIYFSSNPLSHIIGAHLAEGGRAVFVENSVIVLATGDDQIDLVELDRVAFTAEGKIRFQVMNALAATAAVWAAGLNPAFIARALTTFKTDLAMVPGRFNVSDLNGVQVILDYGHNRAAVQALSEAVQSLGTRRTVTVLSLPGDRRTEDLLATVDHTRVFSDQYVVHDQVDLRGQELDELPQLFKCHLSAQAACEIAPDQHEAILMAWKRVAPGERLIIIADVVEPASTTLNGLTALINAERHCETPVTSESARAR
jgi:cyanophycin synthetase